MSSFILLFVCDFVGYKKLNRPQLSPVHRHEIMNGLISLQLNSSVLYYRYTVYKNVQSYFSYKQHHKASIPQAYLPLVALHHTDCRVFPSFQCPAGPDEALGGDWTQQSQKSPEDLMGEGHVLQLDHCWLCLGEKNKKKKIIWFSCYKITYIHRLRTLFVKVERKNMPVEDTLMRPFPTAPTW